LLRDIGVEGEIDIITPPDPEMGDLGFATFGLAKQQKKNPYDVTLELKSAIEEKGMPNGIEGIAAVGPYLNFYFKTGGLAKCVIEEIKVRGKDFGKSQTKQKEKVMIEYSQPNTHKEFHIGHLRNVCIGSSLVNIFRASGYKILSANYVGDVGAHVAKCLWYIKKFNKEIPKENKGKWLGQMYTEASRVLEDKPELKPEVQEVQAKLESGDKDWVKFWQETKKWSLEEFKRIYDLLGVNFDVWFYESEVEKPGKDMVDELLKKGVAQTGEGGAVIVDLNKYGLDIFLILKSDGTSLYATKDLALAKKKFHEYKIDKNIMVVDSRQEFYFKQLFQTLALAGWKKDLQYIGYEFVKLPEGAMASRTGNVVLFDDLYNDVFATEVEEVKTRHADWSAKNIEEAARVLALGALKFDMLKHPVDKVIIFNKKEALAFEGYTGPYVLYVVARINSLLKKSKNKIKKVDFELLKESEEKQLLLLMSQFEEIIIKSLENYNPSVIIKYCFDLAKQYNDFYTQHSVLSAQTPELINARLAISACVKQVLENALGLLGIDTVPEM